MEVVLLFLLGLGLMALPLVLPIVSLVRSNRTREWVDAPQRTIANQQDDIDRLRQQVAELRTSAPASPVQQPTPAPPTVQAAPRPPAQSPTPPPPVVRPPIPAAAKDALLAAGIYFKTHAGCIAAIALIAVTTFKCFLYDLSSLGGLYRIASFVGLAMALTLVSLALQRFVLRAPKEV